MLKKLLWTKNGSFQTKILIRVARAWGATIISRTDEISEEDIGTGARLFELRKIGKENFTFIEALGSLYPSIKVKYSSPIFLTSKSPAAVPISSSLISSVRLTIVAPHARATRRLSVLRSRLMTVIPS